MLLCLKFPLEPSSIESVHDVFLVLLTVFIVLIITGTFTCLLCSTVLDKVLTTSGNFQNNFITQMSSSRFHRSGSKTLVYFQ